MNNIHSLPHSKNKKVIIIAGPTAVGKTATAIYLARHFNTEIISADSRQCFRELNIGVARPSMDELLAVPHHFIGTHSVHDTVTAASFEAYALQKVEELFGKKDTVIMVGGTGLYLRAFCEGLDAIPTINPSIRQQIQQGFDENGIAWLQQQLLQLDKDFYENGEILNPHRAMRALEVVMGTGQSILSYQSKQKKQRAFTIVKYALELPRPKLNERIDRRVEQMMHDGLLKEVQSLVPLRHLNALQTVGYSELFDFLDGNCSLDRAVELIKQHTRQYAKRQVTWFKKDAEFKWIEAEVSGEAIIKNLDDQGL